MFAFVVVLCVFVVVLCVFVVTWFPCGGIRGGRDNTRRLSFIHVVPLIRRKTMQCN